MAGKPIFVGGTGSHAGKSWVATAICRYLYRLGRRVAPFKAQNMSNNSMVCTGGGEIGRAQAAQAEACGLEPIIDMNPILLKPTGELGSQVVVHGKPWRNIRALEYYEHFDFLLERVLESYQRLASEFEYVVIEGAGSLTELNLKHRDLVNLGLAVRLNAPSILVADIDRGGVFASVVGTFHLLDADEASLVRTFLINRFRGDRALFADGVRILEEKTGKDCLGVFPFVDDVYLDAEDSLSLDGGTSHVNQAARIAIIRFPHISNFTDFRLIPNAQYLSHPGPEHFDFIFLPGTKNTIEDLLWFRAAGFDSWLLQQMQSGSKVIGVCGGFQMLGERIHDPHGIESTTGSIQGLGLLPMETSMAPEKTTRRVSARTLSGSVFPAYEIHMGITTFLKEVPPFAFMEDGTREGVSTQNVIGTYLHGAFEDSRVCAEYIGRRAGQRVQDKDAHYDKLADWFTRHVELEIFEKNYL